jgi:ABC-type lipoprotein export system ATPase subunit
MIELKNITKTYKTIGIDGKEEQFEVLKKINLEVGQGRIISISGPSGSGKSTLLNIMGLLDDFDSGEMKIQGKDIANINKREKARIRNEYIGFIFQDNNLIPELSAVQNVSLPLLISGKYSKNQAEELAKENIKPVLNGQELSYESRIFKSRPSRLSGGQRQRLAIARAIVNKPKVILADEPTGAIDDATSDQVFNILKMVNRELNSALIIVTHDQRLAAKTETQYLLENKSLCQTT